MPSPVTASASSTSPSNSGSTAGVPSNEGNEGEKRSAAGGGGGSSSSRNNNGDDLGAAELDFDWKEVADSVFREDDSPVLLFDGVCNFCSGGVNMCIDLDGDCVFRFASLQSRVGKALLIRSGRRHDDMSSLALVTPEKSYFESAAVLRVIGRLSGLPGWMRVGSKVLRNVLPSPILDAGYKIVSHNRHLLGEKTECRIDWDGSLQKRFVPDPVEDLKLDCVESSTSSKLTCIE